MCSPLAARECYTMDKRTLRPPLVSFMANMLATVLDLSLSVVSLCHFIQLFPEYFGSSASYTMADLQET